jgi:hypothetical protein
LAMHESGELKDLLTEEEKWWASRNCGNEAYNVIVLIQNVY